MGNRRRRSKLLPHAGPFIIPPDYKCVGQGVKCQRDAKSKEIWEQTGMTNELYFTNISPFLETREWKMLIPAAIVETFLRPQLDLDSRCTTYFLYNVVNFWVPSVSLHLYTAHLTPFSGIHYTQVCRDTWSRLFLFNTVFNNF